MKMVEAASLVAGWYSCCCCCCCSKCGKYKLDTSQAEKEQARFVLDLMLKIVWKSCNFPDEEDIGNRARGALTSFRRLVPRTIKEGWTKKKPTMTPWLHPGPHLRGDVSRQAEIRHFRVLPFQAKVPCAICAQDCRLEPYGCISSLGSGIR